MKLAILHFQPLELYPPVMNCIRDLEKEKVIEVKIFTTHSKNNWFSSSKTGITKGRVFRGKVWQIVSNICLKLK